MFPSQPNKGNKQTILLCVGGKNGTEDPNFGEEKASRFRIVDSDMQGLTITMHVIFHFLSCVYMRLARCHTCLDNLEVLVYA